MNHEVRELVTGGDPFGALLGVLAQRSAEGGGGYRVSVAHDETCPCVTREQPITGCTCEIVEVHFKGRVK